MLSTSVAALAYAPSMLTVKAPTVQPSMSAGLGDISFESKPWTSDEISDKAGMEALAKKLNPTVGFWGAHPYSIAQLTVESWGRVSQPARCALANALWVHMLPRRRQIRVRRQRCLVADPLGIVEGADPETIGWFRHAEIKHGR
eukprot:3993804-Prymnesium_polylepis.1